MTVLLLQIALVSALGCIRPIWIIPALLLAAVAVLIARSTLDYRHSELYGDDEHACQCASAPVFVPVSL
jgi:hypothetical protein